MNIMGNNKFQQYNDPEWVEVLTEAFLDINIGKLSDGQKKLLRTIYFEKLNSGLNPKKAITQALQIVLCFE